MNNTENELESSAKETEIEDPTEFESIDFTYSITSYGADYPVDSLVKRLKQNKIRIPSFQRGYVWSLSKACRFIESLLIGLPVPGIFLTRDTNSADLLVIDGQQRLKTLEFFYNGQFNDRVFRLRDVQEKYEGKTYEDLNTDDQQRLDDSIIHATIVRQDEPSEDHSSIYSVFERINTGGMQLQPQEIRSAIYPGKFADLLKELNENIAWRNIYGNKNNRLKDQEFILRFFAMYLYRDNYTKPLKGFLNAFMAENRDLQLHKKDELVEIFEKTVLFVNETLGKQAFRPIRALNASVFDSGMVAIATMIYSNKGTIDKDRFLKKYNKLLKNQKYLDATTDGTSDETVVANRMEIAIDTLNS